MADYEYDENLPYVVATEGRAVLGRFPDAEMAERFAETFRFTPDIIDTTPKPRVPDDAKFITYIDKKAGRHYAERADTERWLDGGGVGYTLEELPGVTPETMFTVLDERSR